MTRTPRDRAAAVLRKRGIARTRELERAGVNRTQLRRLVATGTVARIGRGLYTLPDAEPDEHQALAEAARRVPAGVICLLSALRFHGLTTQNPFEVWMALERKSWRPQLDYPPLRLLFFSGDAFTEGVERHDVGGVSVRVFSAAKTVADCFKYRNKIGIDVALEALRDYRRLHPKRLETLWRYAEVDRVSRVIRPYVESLA